MANSKIKITFGASGMNVGDYIQWDLFDTRTGLGVTSVREDYTYYRQNSFQIPVGQSVEFYANRAIHFNKYFFQDYNGLGLYTVTLDEVESSVTYETIYDYITFALPNVSGDAVIEITNNATYVDYRVDSYSASADTINPCLYIKHNFVTNINTASYSVDGFSTPVNASSFPITYPRGAEFSVILTDADGSTINYPSQTEADPLNGKFAFQSIYYGKLLSSNLVIQNNTQISGTTVVLNMLHVENLILEYSLNGSIWQSSTSFTGQIPGDYTAYVRDQFGCEITKPFTVSGTSKLEPYFAVSKANAFNFVRIEEIDGNEIFQNQENTFYRDCSLGVNYKIPAIFNRRDKAVIQIKTNNQDVSLFLRKTGEADVELPLVKMSDNLDKFSSLDCFAYEHSSGKMALYYTEGNTYNELGEVTGQYVLNGNVPGFARKDNYVEVGNLGTYKIDAVLIDSVQNKKVIILNTIHVGGLIPTKSSSVYNLLTYDIYQYEFDLYVLEGIYDLLFKTTPLNGVEQLYLSENFDVQDEHRNSVQILYYNNPSNNRSIFYKYGVRNVLRHELTEKESYFLQENEININDNSVRSIKSFLNKGDRYLFDDLTTNQMETLVIALSCEYIFINGISYTKDGEINIEQVSNTNLYSVEAKLLKNNESYSIEETGYSGTDEVGEDILVPNIITDGTDLIKI